MSFTSEVVMQLDIKHQIHSLKSWDLARMVTQWNWSCDCGVYGGDKTNSEAGALRSGEVEHLAQLLPPLTITIPFAAADTLGESLELAVLHEWVDTVKAAARYATYGPDYRRSIAEALVDLKHQPTRYRYEIVAKMIANLESATGGLTVGADASPV